VNLCRSCREELASLTAFDRHRVGEHAYTWSMEHPEGRRCLVNDELLDAGMELDSRPRWRMALSDDKRSELAALGGPGSKTVRAGRNPGA
jgi:hypothetical protein